MSPVKRDVDSLPKHLRVAALSRRIVDVNAPLMCEWCWERQAVDCHHIEEKGMGGRKNADIPENLILLCRHHHEMAHESLISKADLKERVALILKTIEEMHSGTT